MNSAETDVTDKSEEPQSLNMADYFTSYADVSVHELMLKDKPRTLAYKTFIDENKDFFHDKVVMDVGAGTGILSLFAAAAGARKVYAVEASDIVHACQKIVHQNGFADTITVIHGRVEDIEIPESTVDIIVSEWMGFYLLHESMLDSVLFARDKWLSKDGLMMPSNACLYLCPVDMSAYCQEHFEFWNCVYGFDFSALLPSAIQKVLQKPEVAVIKSDQCLAGPAKIANLDMNSLTVHDVQKLKQRLSFPLENDGQLHGFACWFDVTFDLPNLSHAPASDRLVLSTSPSSPETHWKQTIFFLPTSFPVKGGSMINCQIELLQDEVNKRHYNISIEMKDSVEDSEEEEEEGEDLEEDAENQHPLPCSCDAGRCRIIRAIMEKYESEHSALEEEAEIVDVTAEIDTARTLDMENGDIGEDSL